MFYRVYNNKNLGRILLVFWVCVGLVFSATPVTAQTGTDVVVRIAPANLRVVVGETVDVAVEVVNVSDLYAIDVLLGFDPQAVEVVDLDPDLDGPQLALGTLLEPGFVLFNLAENELGRARLVMTQLNPATPKSGTGTIVVFRLRGKQVSPPTALEFIQVKFSSPSGQEVVVDDLQDGQVEVVQSLSGPTPTSIPSQAPGTPMPTPLPDTPTPTRRPSTATQDLPLTASPTASPSATLAPATATLSPSTPTLPPSPTASPTTLPPSQTPLPSPTLSGTSDGLADEATATSVPPTEETETLDTGTIVLVSLALVLIGGAGVALFITNRPRSTRRQ